MTDLCALLEQTSGLLEKRIFIGFCSLLFNSTYRIAGSLNLAEIRDSVTVHSGAVRQALDLNIIHCEDGSFSMAHQKNLFILVFFISITFKALRD